MWQIVFVGVGAGVAAALLFASIASGSIVATLLFYLAPQPILIAALGWSHWAGIIAALSAAIGLATLLGFFFFTVFLIGVGLPAWWLGYLSLLARPAANATPDGLEWYPIGRLVFWAAVIGTVVAAAIIPFFGSDEETFRAGMKSALERILRAQTRTPADAPLEFPGVSDAGLLLDLLVKTMLPAAAVLATIIYTFNLWLAGRIVRISGRLTRPWPDIAAMRFPAFMPGLLVGAVAAAFLPGLLGIVANVLAATLLMAYAFLGLAVLHSVTKGVPARGLVLASVYAAMVLFSWPTSWPLLVLSMLGLIDTAFDLRGRIAQKRGPPSVRT